MSDSAPSASSPGTAAKSFNREVKLISHSNLFYWWPVWVLGLVFAMMTLMEGHRMAIIPDKGKVTITESATSKQFKIDYTVTPQTNKSASVSSEPIDKTVAEEYRYRVTNKSWFGSLFVVVLVLTVVITNVPLRGLWSFLVIVLIVVLALIITLLHWWDDIFSLIGGLHIYINMAGYLFISGAIFLVWALATFVFDRRAYIIFTPGQVKVCEHIGDAVRTFDTVGMTFEKQRDDLFRHYALGFGSGDLIVRTSGAERQEIKIQNVLGIGWKLKAVEDLIREKSTTNA